MDIQILSDLHLESPSAYDLFTIPPKARHLALLGDIGNVRDRGFFPFIEIQLRRFQTVFFLLGNHEPYHSSWEESRKQVTNFSQKVSQRKAEGFGTFVFLDRTRYDVSADTTVLGCTLYSHVPTQHEDAVGMGLNDFFQIDGWSVAEHNDAHAGDLAWLNEQVSSITTSEPGRKIVIFTHYGPIAADGRATDPMHIGSPISTGFATDLTSEQCWKSPSICLWAFGHTHFNCDFTLEVEGSTRRILTNQRGYYFKQAPNFDIGRVTNV
ncbi:Ser/Thr protein phosphatase superfamily protein [Nannizzia gypsea CBS 118893]|uniref:Ser/Thr protein phosphatase superfamily protein n=1 Tax=Arthroderma gypseum (strain ATCC MYA-4604 / CBS 118893) TaxID=535722 RepID=E4UQU1_ARTGP|nr:Ser/Thr protein phosphatase superfamily protein [Nannizzia gypsea CBS 118893]EFQ99267.1 Ser/Thr protein phosphatase superfamily protein [Nannizzia gypsea CBS 118893]